MIAGGPHADNSDRYGPRGTNTSLLRGRIGLELRSRLRFVSEMKIIPGACNARDVTYDIWHATYDTWHATYDVAFIFIGSRCSIA